MDAMTVRKRHASFEGFSAGTERGDQAQLNRPIEHGGHLALTGGEGAA